MTPPDAHSEGLKTRAAAPRPAVFLCLESLKRRADFLAAARAKRQATLGFVVQGRDRSDGTPTTRIGYTCSKKVGNAVARNRAKRRLRAIARDILPRHGHPGWDYVLIGRRDTTAALPFDTLKSDLVRALRKLHP